MSQGSEGGTEVVVNLYRLTCREKVGGSQRFPLLTKEGESNDDTKKRLRSCI